MARLNVFYEWGYESIDQYGDIIDTHFSDFLAGFHANEKTDTLCLVRNEGSESEGLQDRCWAYVKNGILPGFFSDELGHEMPGMKVPKKYQAEFNKHFVHLNSNHITKY